MQHRFVSVARVLREKLTPHEQKLWYFIRNRRCQGYKFRRQVPIGPYVADFCCLEKRLIIELDGGGHADPKIVERDSERDQFFRCNGFSVLRFWNNEVDDNLDGVYQRITETILSYPSPRQGRTSPARGEVSG